ncbi:MAG: hypothetical protein NVSMB22_03680 [Chloroflexota bacterium]
MHADRFKRVGVFRRVDGLECLLADVIDTPQRVVNPILDHCFLQISKSQFVRDELATVRGTTHVASRVRDPGASSCPR